MIPKIIHLPWLGVQDIPSKYIKHAIAWKKLNPDHEVTLWCSCQNNYKLLTKLLGPHAIAVKNINSDARHFANFSLMEQFLSRDINLPAVDLLKLDVMYHIGGFIFDLSLKPKKTLEGNIPVDSVALCELKAEPHPSIETLGNYHFHASEPGKSLYWLSQMLQKEVLKKIDQKSDILRILKSSNPFVAHRATIYLSGFIVFVAIDCMIRAGIRPRSLVKPFDITQITLPKITGQRANTGDDLDLLDDFMCKVKTIIDEIRVEWSNLFMSAKENPTACPTIFSKSYLLLQTTYPTAFFAKQSKAVSSASKNLVMPEEMKIAMSQFAW